MFLAVKIMRKGKHFDKIGEKVIFENWKKTLMELSILEAIFFSLSLFKFIEATLVNKSIEVSGVHFYETWPVIALC